MNPNIKDIYPLSYMQAGMLFQSLLDPEAKLYFEQLTCEIKGDLNIIYFKESWKKVLLLNPILRTVFDWNGETPIQIVLETIKFEFEYTNFSKVRNIDAQMLNDNDKDLKRGFNLEIGPLIRFKLFKVDSVRYFFRISYHHIILDGGSLPFVFEDFTDAYYAFIHNQPFLTTKRVPYKEYIRWLLTQKKSGETMYWKKYLRNYENGIQIPVNHSDKHKNHHAVVKLKSEVPELVVKQLIHVSENYHITLNNLLQCNWAILLYEKSQLTDIVFGSTFSGRPINLKFSEEMIGLFINTLPMRVQIDRSKSFIEHAQKLQLDWAEMQEYSSVSLSEIKKLVHLRTEKDPFQSIVAYSDKPLLPVTKKLPFEMISLDYRELTNYDLTVDITFNGSLSFQLSYPEGKISSEEAKKIVSRYVELLEKFGNFPDQPVRCVIENNGTKMSKVHIEEKQENKKNRKLQVNEKAHTREERILKSIWEKVFKIETISIHDNFFELGGDSITSLQILALLLQKKYVLELRNIFEKPTIYELAKVLKKNEVSLKKTSFVIPEVIKRTVFAKNSGSVENILPLTYIQNSILQEQVEQNSKVYHDQSLFTYVGDINYEIFEKAWNVTIENNQTLRTIFYWNSKLSVQIVLKKYYLELVRVDVTNKTASDQQNIINNYKTQDLENSFKLEKYPPFRIFLFKLSPARHVFLLSFHILILDGWCFAFILNDFQKYYKALIARQAIFPVKRKSFSEYVVWLYNQNLRKGIEYWSHYISKTDIGIEIQRNCEKDALKEFVITSEKISIPRNLSLRIKLLSKQEKVTINTIFQTAWAYTLYKMSKKKNIIFGSTVSGRPPELVGSENIIGLFFNDIPIKFVFKDVNTFFDSAREIQSEFSSSKQYEYISLSQIKKALLVSQKAELFQTLLIFENYPKHEEMQLKSEKNNIMNEAGNWRREASATDMSIYIEFNDSSIEIKYIKHLFAPSLIRKILKIYLDTLNNFE